MSFVTALALGIAAFIALPILAHRLRRRRAEERPFPAAALVPPAPPRARRRARLEDRALFGVRALAIAALALLGASPLVRCTRLSLSRSSGASMAVAIVIDDSMSMRVKAGNQTRFARAKAAASELLAGTRDGDAVGVVLAGSPPRVALAPTTELDVVSSVVSSVTESDRATDLDGAFHLAETLLAALPQVDKRVVVLSDLADGKPDAPALGENALVPIWAPLAEIRETKETDCALTSADDTGGRVVVHIACGKDVSAAGRRVEVRAGERVVGGATATAAPELSIDVPTTEKEALAAHLLGGDAIASDDVAPVLVSQSGAIGVVAEAADETAVTGGPPVVEQAFAALRSDLAARPLPAVPDQPGDFNGFFAVVVDDPPGFTPEQRRALTQYLEGGGVILVALGPRASAAPLGATLQPLLDHATTWSEAKVKGAKPDADAVLLGEAARSLVDLGAKKRTTLSPADIGSVESLVAWSDGAPLVARRTLGRGEAWIVTLPFALDASDLPLRPAFIALLDAFVATTHTHAAPRRADVGATWTLPSGASAATGPSGPIELVREGGHAKLSPPLAGAYHVTIDGKDELRVAAPIARETDLRPRALKSQEASSHLGATQAQVDISPHVAIALLLFLFVEMVLRVRAQRTHHAASLALTLVLLAPAAARADDDETVHQDGRFHAYVGANVAGVLPGVWQGTGVGVEVAVRAGAINDAVQLDFSLSPGSSILANANGCCGGNQPPIVFFRGDVSAAYLIKLSDEVYWPIRLGVGGGALIAPLSCADCTTSTTTFGFAEIKLDVVGALIRTSKHFMVQMEIPSVRVLVVPQGTSIIEWNTTLEMAYVF